MNIRSVSKILVGPLAASLLLALACGSGVDTAQGGSDSTLESDPASIASISSELPKLCMSSQDCDEGTHCSTEDGVCDRPPNCGKGQICPAVCYGKCRKAKCDYKDPARHYVSRDPQRCMVMLFACDSGERPFFDDCGCGCEAQCPTGACGPALGLPNQLCPDGVSVSGPTGRCLLSGNACAWEVASCP